MKHYFWVFCFLLGTYFPASTLAYATSRTEIVKHTDSLDPDRDGFWSEKKTWKSRYVKYWKPKTVYVPIWKTVWSPIIQKEWVPLPNTPPGWKMSNSNPKITEYEY